jgi:alpha/beta superfamily hydrolase
MERNTQRLTTVRQFAGPAGTLEALFEHPLDSPRAVMVFGHPHPLHGGTMHTKVVYRAAKTFLELGCAVLRFNFRGVGASAGQWDNGRGEQNDFLAGLDVAATTYPGVELWAGGFSFGAWVALCRGIADSRITTLLAIAPPVGRYDFTDVAASPKPMHFIHGEQDELVPVAEMRAQYEEIRAPKTLTVIEGANHLFDGRVAEVGNVIRALFGAHPEEHS